jgi:hypothetical protein
LVEIGNGLPGATPEREINGRKTAVRRIWKGNSEPRGGCRTRQILVHKRRGFATLPRRAFCASQRPRAGRPEASACPILLIRSEVPSPLCCSGRRSLQNGRITMSPMSASRLKTGQDAPDYSGFNRDRPPLRGATVRPTTNWSDKVLKPVPKTTTFFLIVFRPIKTAGRRLFCLGRPPQRRKERGQGLWRQKPSQAGVAPDKPTTPSAVANGWRARYKARALSTLDDTGGERRSEFRGERNMRASVHPCVHHRENQAVFQLPLIRVPNSSYRNAERNVRNSHFGASFATDSGQRIRITEASPPSHQMQNKEPNLSSENAFLSSRY